MSTAKRAQIVLADNCKKKEIHFSLEFFFGNVKLCLKIACPPYLSDVELLWELVENWTIAGLVLLDN